MKVKMTKMLGKVIKYSERPNAFNLNGISSTGKKFGSLSKMKSPGSKVELIWSFSMAMKS